MSRAVTWRQDRKPHYLAVDYVPARVGPLIGMVEARAGDVVARPDPLNQGYLTRVRLTRDPEFLKIENEWLCEGEVIEDE